MLAEHVVEEQEQGEYWFIRLELECPSHSLPIGEATVEAPGRIGHALTEVDVGSSPHYS